MRVLDFVQISQFSGELKDCFVRIHISELEEVNALLCKDLSHTNEIAV